MPVPDVALLTGASGEFALTAPAAGRYQLGFLVEDFVARELEVEVTSSAPPVLDVVLARRE